MRRTAPNPKLAAAREGLERILLLRLGSMGDIIHTLPALATLRRAFPAATLAWVVEERWAGLLAARPGVSRPGSSEMPLLNAIHTVNLKAWRQAFHKPQTWKEGRALFRELRQGAYQAAIDFQGAVRSALLMKWSGAPLRVGASRPRESAAGLYYTRRVPFRGRHVVEHNLSLVEALAPGAPPVLEFPLPIDPAAEAWADAELQRRGLASFAILTPGAGWGAKQWPPARYGEVAQGLARHGLRSLVNAGPGEEEIARAVVEASGSTAQAFTCSLAELIALTRRARLAMGGDTGPLHLAAALGVPVVGIYGPTDPARNGPFGARCRVLRSPESRTSHARRAAPEEGLLSLTSAGALRAARELLAGAP
ncbi:MAG TPA: glycosyltransferase family 9 protein [Terriglobales bacterium]|nr:glycosyltransferase family 9 protein [Terriglobales bacterium]